MVFDLIEPYLAGDQVLLAIDDTLARKRGVKSLALACTTIRSFQSQSALMNWGHVGWCWA